MKSILEALQKRTSQSAFGYGLSTAEPYVRGVFSELGEGDCKEQFHLRDTEAALKYASGVLTYATPEMEIEEKETSVGAFRDMVPDGVEVPENTLMIIRHVLTTTKEDRDNDVLETKGASLDPKAPLLWQHMHTMPIGGVLGKVNHSDSELKVVSALIDLNDLTSDAAKLVEANVLRFSHGFRALEFEERKVDNGMPGFRVTKFEIMEASLVSVPSNTDAAIEAFSKAKLESKYFKSMQQHLLKDASKPQVQGWSADGSDTQLLLKLGGAEVVVKTVREISEQHDETKEAQPSEIVPPVAKDELLPAADSDEQIPTDTESAAVSEKDVKGGRTISAANLKTLQDVKEDIDELGAMDIPRAGKALCTRCSSQLEKVINSAKPRDDDDDEKPKPDEEKPKAALTYHDAATFLLAEGTKEQLADLTKLIDAMQTVDTLDQHASTYRTLIGQST